MDHQFADEFDLAVRLAPMTPPDRPVAHGGLLTYYATCDPCLTNTCQCITHDASCGPTCDTCGPGCVTIGCPTRDGQTCWSTCNTCFPGCRG
jgi:hypothetical protein